MNNYYINFEIILNAYLNKIHVLNIYAISYSRNIYKFREGQSILESCCKRAKLILAIIIFTQKQNITRCQQRTNFLLLHFRKKKISTTAAKKYLHEPNTLHVSCSPANYSIVLNKLAIQRHPHDTHLDKIIFLTSHIHRSDINIYPSKAKRSRQRQHRKGLRTKSG